VQSVAEGGLIELFDLQSAVAVSFEAELTVLSSEVVVILPLTSVVLVTQRQV
jgi:hypothetical protein